MNERLSRLLVVATRIEQNEGVVLKRAVFIDRAPGHMMRGCIVYWKIKRGGEVSRSDLVLRTTILAWNFVGIVLLPATTIGGRSRKGGGVSLLIVRPLTQ
jgi:hypothetical protein